MFLENDLGFVVDIDLPVPSSLNPHFVRFVSFILQYHIIVFHTRYPFSMENIYSL